MKISVIHYKDEEVKRIFTKMSVADILKKLRTEAFFETSFDCCFGDAKECIIKSDLVTFVSDVCAERRGKLGCYYWGLTEEDASNHAKRLDSDFLIL